MIWGLTNIEREKRRKEKKRLGWFAWYPVRLKDGRWCWLQRVTYSFWGAWGCGSGYDYKIKERGD